jgi:hypothetical protein
LNGLDDQNILDELFSDELVVIEDIQGSRSEERRVGKECIIQT